ncbi:MAG: bifunctional metallophosphatase/5'-nucleotidase [Alloprevotella sp.]|nr:bifunctional metallophosphatase/5'-nucleotidase [Alloprevotella sp.]
MNTIARHFVYAITLLFTLSTAKAYADNPPHTVTIAVFSINDFHGAFVQDLDKGIPGAPSVLHCLDSLKAVYPYHLTVAAGDNFGGSYFYKATKGLLLPPFFDMAEINISAVGNHEFDDGQPELARKWQGDALRPANWQFDYICANIYDEKGMNPPYMAPYKIAEVRVSPTQSVKVAFIGLLASSAKEQIKARNTIGLTFSGRYTRVLDSLKSLPEFQEVREAAVHNLLIHIGTRMKDGKPQWVDKSLDELYAIGDNLIDGIFSGHSHDPVCGLINDKQYPVVQGHWHGNYISMIKYVVDLDQNKVISATPEIVKVPAKSKEQLIGRALRLQELTDSLLDNTKTTAGVPIGTQLTVCTEVLPHDRTEMFVDSPVGKLVCSSFSETFRKVAHKKDKEVIVGVNHFGGIRANLPKGKISVLDVGEVLPFGNPLCVYEMTGKELYRLIDAGFNNHYFGRIQRSNLNVELNGDGHVKRLVYVSPKGKKKVIKDNTRCYVVADEYMTTGGDDYSPELFPNEKRVKVGLPLTTDCFIDYLRQQPQIPVK